MVHRKNSDTPEGGGEQQPFWIRWKPVVDSLSGIAVIGTLIFIGLQWREMKTGSVDTHNLAVAAQNQAHAASSQAQTSRSQLNEMEDSLKRQDELIKQGISQAKSASSLAGSSRRSADAAWQAVKETKNEDRPWLGFVKFAPSAPVSGETLHLDANLQNSGKSPAQMLSTLIWIGPHVGEIYAFSELELPAIASQTMESRAVLVPGQSYTPNDPDSKLGIADLQRIDEGVVNLYAVGISVYRGTNEAMSIEHRTSMCEVWVVKQKKWNLCGFLNDAD